MAKTLAKHGSSYRHREPSQNKSSTGEEVQYETEITPHLPPGKGLALNKTEAAGYIAEMLPVLCNMAKDVDLKFLNYLLEMAYEESIYRGNDGPKPGHT